jgi:hypothetical protein
MSIPENQHSINRAPVMPNQSGNPRAIAALVTMRCLIAALGFAAPNERARRAPCLVHGGKNPTSFSWREDGHWRCYSCGNGGDQIALVRAVRKCSFPEAVEFLAALAGVEYRPSFRSREAIEYQKKKRDRETAAADGLLALEFAAWIEARDEVLRLEGIRRNAGKRLDAIHGGEQERWPGEEEDAWDALAAVYWQMPYASAAYYVASFAPAKDRFLYALDTKERERAIEDCLDRGWVADEKGYRFEVQL